jgi:hypothetical protein
MARCSGKEINLRFLCIISGQRYGEYPNEHMGVGLGNVLFFLTLLV